MNGKVVTSAQELRRLRIITGIDRATSGIEYGPLHRVVMTREMCPGVRYVDYKPREQLMAHYAHDPAVDVSLIPEIDIVTGGRQITEFVPEESIDFAIASHVMEHVPDVIGWLEANLRLLRPGGRIALAFPDRRFCFDLAKQPTSFHEVVAAYLEKRTQPNFTQICDHVINCRKVTPGEVWNGTLTPQNAPPVHATAAAVGLLRTLVHKTDYHDVHCWKFSDTEFMEMLGKIKQHFGLPFEVMSFYPTQRNTTEFFASLIKT
ncbi:MAG: methyltransferase domain-containing protein [Paracoccaceae bacterium]|nr:methyltransferase domain-containing protein [Paracoccaceae bacterium]